MSVPTLKITGDAKGIEWALGELGRLIENDPEILDEFHAKFLHFESLYWIEEAKLTKEEVRFKLHPTDEFLEFLAARQ